MDILHSDDPAREQWYKQIAAVYLLHYERLIKMATRMLSNAADAEDAIHKAILKLLQKPPLLIPPEELAAYIGRAVFNECINQLRAAKRIMVADIELQALLQALGSHEDPAIVAGEIETYRTDWYERTIRHIEQLDGNHQKVTKTRLLEGEAYEAIAAKLGISFRYAQQLLYESLKMLRSLEDRYILSLLGLVVIIAALIHFSRF